MLKATGLALAGGVLAAGTATAHGEGQEGDAGEVVSVGNGEAFAYTEHGGGMLSAIGVRFDATALQGLPETPADWPPEGVPEGTPFGVVYRPELPTGYTGRFDHVTLDWNPGGHEPQGLYTHPHFDFHFYLLGEDEVAAIPPGVAEYEIPADLMPANTYYASEFDPNAAQQTVSGTAGWAYDQTAGRFWANSNTTGENGW